MDRSEFEADLERTGYAMRESEIPPNQHRAAHTHDFDARLFILDGALTLVVGDTRHTYAAGQACAVPAGTAHEEATGADGVRYLAGRRTPPAAGQMA